MRKIYSSAMLTVRTGLISFCFSTKVARSDKEETPYVLYDVVHKFFYPCVSIAKDQIRTLVGSA